MATLRTTIVLTILLLGFASFGLSGCERQGPAEEMGERIDDAVDDAADKIDDAADDASERIDEIFKD